jgi:hypothetical protein
MSDEIIIDLTEVVENVLVELQEAQDGAPGPAGPAGTTSWAGITDKPATFPPEAHTHLSSAILDASSGTTFGTPNVLAKFDSNGDLQARELSARIMYIGGAQSNGLYITNAGDNHSNIRVTNLENSWLHELPDAPGTLALTSSTTGVPDALANGTISGSLLINSTTISYGTAAAAAHRAALQLGDLATCGPNEVSITAATTLTSSAFGLIHVCSGTAADYAVTLPSARGNASGRIIALRMSGALTKFVTITALTGNLIEGLVSRIMWANESAILMSDGNNWTKIGGRTRPMIFAGENTTSTSVASGTLVAIPLNSTLQNNTGLMNDTVSSTAVCRIRRPGLYAIGALATLERAGSFAGLEVQCRVLLNSLSASATGPAMLAMLPTNSNTTPTTFAHVAFATTRPLAANDYLALSAHQSTGGTMTTRTGASVRPNLTVTEIPSW